MATTHAKPKGKKPCVRELKPFVIVPNEIFDPQFSLKPAARLLFACLCDCLKTGDSEDQDYMRTGIFDDEILVSQAVLEARYGFSPRNLRRLAASLREVGFIHCGQLGPWPTSFEISLQYSGEDAYGPGPSGIPLQFIIDRGRWSKVPRRIIWDKSLSPTARMILAFLAVLAQKFKEVRPSRRTIGNAVGAADVRTVQAALKNLRKRELLSWEKQRFADSNVYRVLWDKLPPSPNFDARGEDIRFPEGKRCFVWGLICPLPGHIRRGPPKPVCPLSEDGDECMVSL